MKALHTATVEEFIAFIEKHGATVEEQFAMIAFATRLVDGQAGPRAQFAMQPAVLAWMTKNAQSIASLSR